jgi:hypothetical protein
VSRQTVTPATTGMRIFCDLDGVLTDFEGGVLAATGCAVGSLSAAVMWSQLRQVDSFFERLRWTKDGQELWKSILQLCATHGVRSPEILSGVPAGDAFGREAQQQKQRWCAKNLGADVTVQIGKSSEKYRHSGSGAILIDDNVELRDAWVQRGGIFIHHQSARGTLQELTMILTGTASDGTAASVAAKETAVHRPIQAGISSSGGAAPESDVEGLPPESGGAQIHTTASVSKTFIILRGTTGMGKSHFANIMEQEHGATVCSNDRYWSGTRRAYSLAEHCDRAVPWCQRMCEDALRRCCPIVILDNLNMKINNFERLYVQAKTLGFTVIIVDLQAKDLRTAQAAVLRNKRPTWGDQECIAMSNQWRHYEELPQRWHAIVICGDGEPCVGSSLVQRVANAMCGADATLPPPSEAAAATGRHRGLSNN